MVSGSQIVHVPFAAGIDDKVDPKQAPAGTLSSLRNAYFSRSGEIAKRFGLQNLGTTDTDEVGFVAASVFTRDGALCCIGTDHLVYTYIPSLTRWKKGPLAPGRLSASTETVVGALGSANQPQVAFGSGTVVYAWHVGSPYSVGEIYIKAVDLATGAHVVPPTRLSTVGSCPRVVVDAGVAYVAWVEGDSSPRSLYAARLTLSGAFPLTASVPVVAGTVNPAGGFNVSSNAPFDISRLQDGASGICWVWGDSTSGLIIGITDSSLSFTSMRAYGGAGLCSSISISSRPYLVNGNTFVSYLSGASTWRVGAYDWYAAAVVSDIVVAGATGGAVDASGNSILQVGDDEAVLVLNGHVRTYQPSTGTLINGVTVYEGDVLSRPFLFGGRYYMLTSPERKKANTDVASVVLVDLQYPNLTGATQGVLPAGNIAMRQFSQRTGMGADAAVVSATEVRVVYNTIQLPYNLLKPPPDSIECATITTNPQPRAVEVLKSSLLSGAVPWWFDGSDAGDVGFYGGTPNTSNSATAGGLVAAGTYIVGIGYERMDANGVLHRSPVYLSSFTLGAATAIDVSGSNVTACSKFSQSSLTYLIVYLTDNLLSVLYRYSKPPVEASLPNEWTTVGATPVIVADGIFSYSPRVPVYTLGDALDDVAPPSFLDVCLHRGRVFAVGGDRRTVWFSKLLADEPNVFPGFNEALTIRVDDGSDVVALGSLDTVLVVWTSQGVYYLEGEGPGPSGFPTDYGPARKIAADIGCLTPRSVASCQMGLLFQGTDRQIWLLSRSLSLEPVGRAVEDTIAAYPIVRAATLVENFDQVRFACTTIAGDAGITLVWDYSPGVKQWAIYEHGNVVSACSWGDRYVCVNGAGVVFAELENSWLDNGAWYSVVVETNWFGGPTTWQRVRAVQTVGDYKSAHGFTVELAVDHSPTYQQVSSFTEAEVLVNQGRATVRLGAQNGMNPRCKAMRLRLTDTAPVDVGTGESQRWSGFALEILPQPGLSRHGAANAKR